MLFVEFIAPLKKGTQAQYCLCSLYFIKHNLNIEIAAVGQIKNLLVRGRIVKKSSKLNYPRALNSLKEYVDSPAINMWQITPSGEKEVARLLNIQVQNIETENDTTTLDGLIDKVSNADVRDYLAEAIDCLRIGRLRACVVFVWSGSVYVMRERLMNINSKTLNAYLQKHDPKSRTISSLDDFVYIKDSNLLLAMQDCGLCDKNQRDILEECLNLRNKCGHPGRYSPGPKRVSAFIEDIISILFA